MALSPILSCFLICSLLSTASAFDITKILNQYSDYTLFNQELTKTGVAEEINERKAVTILVVSNDAISSIHNQTEASIADIMRIHVLLDYYDSAKIKTLKDEATITTLYQTTGTADREQGFIIVSKDDNEIRLGSAVAESVFSAKVNKVVTSVPYDVSVIEVSSPIIPFEMDDSDSQSPSDSPASDDGSLDDSPTPAPAPSHDHKHKDKHHLAPAPSPSDSPAESPSDDDDKDDVDEDDHPADAVAPSVDQKSSSSRNTIVSGFVLLASFVANL